jgi:hypothetical protein
MCNDELVQQAQAQEQRERQEEHERQEQRERQEQQALEQQQQQAPVQQQQQAPEVSVAVQMLNQIEADGTYKDPRTLMNQKILISGRTADLVTAERLRLGTNVSKTPIRTSVSVGHPNDPYAHVDQDKLEKIKKNQIDAEKKAKKKGYKGATGETLALAEQIKDAKKQEEKERKGSKKKVASNESEEHANFATIANFENKPLYFKSDMFDEKYNEKTKTTLDIQAIRKKLNGFDAAYEASAKSLEKPLTAESKGALEAMVRTKECAKAALQAVVGANGVDYETGNAISEEDTAKFIASKDAAIAAYKNCITKRLSIIADITTGILENKYSEYEEHTREIMKTEALGAMLSRVDGHQEEAKYFDKLKSMNISFDNYLSPDTFVGILKQIDENKDTYEQNKATIDSLFSEFISDETVRSETTLKSRMLNQYRATEEGEKEISVDLMAYIDENLMGDNVQALQKRMNYLSAAITYLLTGKLSNNPDFDDGAHFILEQEYGIETDRRKTQRVDLQKVEATELEDINAQNDIAQVKSELQKNKGTIKRARFRNRDQQNLNNLQSPIEGGRKEVMVIRAKHIADKANRAGTKAVAASKHRDTIAKYTNPAADNLPKGVATLDELQKRRKVLMERSFGVIGAKSNTGESLFRSDRSFGNWLQYPAFEALSEDAYNTLLLNLSAGWEIATEMDRKKEVADAWKREHDGEVYQSPPPTEAEKKELKIAQNKNLTGMHTIKECLRIHYDYLYRKYGENAEQIDLETAMEHYAEIMQDIANAQLDENIAKNIEEFFDPKSKEDMQLRARIGYYHCLSSYKSLVSPYTHIESYPDSPAAEKVNYQGTVTTMWQQQGGPHAPYLAPRRGVRSKTKKSDQKKIKWDEPYVR